MTARDRRAVLVGATVLAAVSVLRLAPWGLRTLHAAEQRLESRMAMLVEARALVAAAPSVRESLAVALRSFVDLAPEIIAGRTQAEAAANLTSLVTLLAGQSRLKVVRLTPAQDSVPGVFRPVTAHAEFEGDIAGLAAFLRHVETGRPLLTIRSLSVVAPDPVSRPGAPETLQVEAHVEGWYLAEAAP